MRSTLSTMPRLILLAAATLALYAVAGCGGNAAHAPDASTPGATTGAFGLPAPHEAIRHAVYVNSQRTRQADQYTPVIDGYPTHIEPAGTDLLLKPEWGSSQPPGITQAARTLYAFDIPGYYLPSEINLGWTDPPTPGNLWIGMASWGHDRWDWYQGTASRVPLNGLAAYQSAEHGVLVAVVLLGTQQATLDWVRVGPKLWSIEAVTSGGDYGQFSSLALDSAGQPHIACYDAEFTRLMYYHHDGTQWLGSVVDHDGDVGRYACLALKSTGEPGIAYLDFDNQRLKLATYFKAAWYFNTLDNSNAGGWFPALQYDADEYPHIAYSAIGNIMKYAYYDGVYWNYETVAAAGANMDAANSLVLDSSGQPFIAFSATTGVKFAILDAGVWHVEMALAGNVLLGTPRCMYLDGANSPVIGAYAYTVQEPRLLYKSAGTWKALDIPLPNASGAELSLCPTSHDEPRFSCYGSGLEYGAMEEGTWQLTTVDNSGWTGLYTSLALDSQDDPHISYYDAANKRLMYARYIAP